MIERATNGQITIETKVDLFPDTEIPEAVISGRVDMGVFYTPWVSGTWPQWDFGSLPFYFADVNEYQQALHDPRMITLLDKMFREAGLVFLADAAEEGIGTLWSNKPVRTLDDWKTLKIRTPGLLQTYAIDLLGGSTLTIAFAEVSEAMARGTVDAMVSDHWWAFTAGFADVSKYINEWGGSGAFGRAIVINEDTFDSLPPNLQEILKEESRRFADMASYGYEVGIVLAVSAAEASGLERIVPDKAERAKAVDIVSQATTEKWLEDAGKWGPEIISIISEYASGAK